MKILITAPPKTGKTTLLKKLIEAFPQNSIAGLTTEEILDHNKNRIGFESKIIQTNEVILIAHIKKINSAINISKYKIDINAINQSVEKALNTEKPILFIDEIGRMQAYSDTFIATIQKTLEIDNRFVIATIVYDDEPFARTFKKNHNYILLQLSTENRNTLPEIITALYENQVYYHTLQDSQRHYFNQQLKKYVQENNIIMAKKIIEHSLLYVAESRIKKYADRYTTQGEHNTHNTTKNSCSCDLFNSKNEYKDTKTKDCSHIQALKMFLVSKSI